MQWELGRWLWSRCQLKSIYHHSDYMKYFHDILQNDIILYITILGIQNLRYDKHSHWQLSSLISKTYGLLTMIKTKGMEWCSNVFIRQISIFNVLFWYFYSYLNVIRSCSNCTQFFFHCAYTWNNSNDIAEYLATNKVSYDIQFLSMSYQIFST